MERHKKDEEFDPYDKCYKLTKKEARMMNHGELIRILEEYKKYKPSDKDRDPSIEIIENEFKKREELAAEVKRAYKW